MRTQFWPALVVAMALTACGGGSSDSPDQYGKINLGVTDAAIDGAEHVVVEFTGVELKAVNDSSPEVFDFATPRQIDLLALEGGGSEILLKDEVLPAGNYEWLRLKVNAGRTASDSYVELRDGSRHPLFIPSGNQSGLKLIRGFTIGAGSTANFTIDFDLRRSVIRPPGQGGDFLLKPVLRLVDNLQVGALAGTIAPALITATCKPAVYVFTGASTVPDDLGGAPEPFVTARVLQDPATGAYGYRIGFMPVGAYTVALTCEAELDDPETNDTIAFVKTQNVTVAVGATATSNFDVTAAAGATATSSFE